MTLNSRELLTPQQRREIKQIPFDLSEKDMDMYYSLSEYDIEIIKKHRRDPNKLGFAVQLCVIRYPGWSLSDIEDIPRSILEYIAGQLNINPNHFLSYAQREPTKHEHLEEIRSTYGYRNYSSDDSKIIYQNLLSYASENGNSIHLIKMAIEDMRSKKIILPGLTTIEEIVWSAQRKTENHIFKSINSYLSANQKEYLDNILKEKELGKVFTVLSWLKEYPGSHSPEAFLKIIEKLEYLRKIDINIDGLNIHKNRFRQLSRLGSRYEASSIQKFDTIKRYAILTLFLVDLNQDLVDQAIEIHDRQMNYLLSSGRKKQEEIQKTNGKIINNKIIQYSNLVKALVKARSENLDPYMTIETSVMKWDDLIYSAEEAELLSRPDNYDYIDLLSKRFNYLRKYTPALLKNIKFFSNKSSKSLVDALNTINEMNDKKKKKVPDDANIDFVPDRWVKYLYNPDGSINRQYYELAALVELRNRISSGDVSVQDSRKHRDFEDYLIPKNKWEEENATAKILAVSPSFNIYIEERRKTLNDKLNYISNNFHCINKLSIENDKIKLNHLEKDTPPEAKEFSKILYGLLPRVKLPDLLLEVSDWTNFTDHFVHASTGHKPKEIEKPTLIASLMAMGTNVGFTKMAAATKGISYHQMANVSQWRMYDEAINKAQSSLVNFHHSLNLPYNWGNGTTSSSDGMYVQVRSSSLSSSSNAHYPGKGISIYRFVSDQFSSFYVKVVNTNTHDSIHIVDGLLHHETDLNIEEHYTDTAGYTDQVFGLLHLLGFKFAPRLRDLKDSKLYTFEKASNYPKINTILHGKINTKIIQENFDDVLRLAASIKKGTVSGSLIMSKLGSYSRKNKLANALSEMGKIEKTIFILDYISNEVFRHRIQKGLNKGEAINALARVISFGKHGELFERSLKDQLQRASALNIIINAISVWNTVYLEKAVEYLKSKNLLKENLLNYTSSMDWEHINFLGDYSFDMKNIATLNNLRPLNGI